MIYFIKRGKRIDQYHCASYPVIAGLDRRGGAPYRLEGYVERAGFYYLAVFATVGFERSLHSLLCELTTQLKRRNANAKVAG